MDDRDDRDDAVSIQDDTYAAQREELFALLKESVRAGRALIVHGEERLTADDLVRVWQKVRHGFGFSRKERSALEDAGFSIDDILPGR